MVAVWATTNPGGNSGSDSGLLPLEATRALPSYVTSFSSVDNVQMCAEVSVELDFCHLYLCWTVYICTQNSDLAYACSNFKAVSKW